MIISRISRYSVAPLNCFYIGKEKDNLSSNQIIDPMMFQNSSFFDKIINKYKTMQSLFDCRRAFKGFTAQKFCVKHLAKYNAFVDQYDKKGTVLASQLLSEDLFKKYKSAIKQKQFTPFHLQKANKLQIMQVRTITNQLSLFKTIDQWFQITCRFTPITGQNCFYHVFQRNSKGKMFKIVKLDLH